MESDAAADQGDASRRSAHLGVVTSSDLDTWATELERPKQQVIVGDAREIKLPDHSVDLIVTSPPYWKKRDYGHENQIGQEATPADYVASMLDCLKEWRRLLRPTGSVFLNIGDRYYNRSLVGIPGRVEAAAVDDSWLVRNRIIWTKEGGMPEPARNRLANRHEYILHLTLTQNYYYDLLGYTEAINGNGANPGDVWHINPDRNMGYHLAPFPRELVRRAIELACPSQVCSICNVPRQRIVQRTAQLELHRDHRPAAPSS